MVLLKGKQNMSKQNGHVRVDELVEEITNIYKEARAIRRGGVIRNPIAGQQPHVGNSPVYIDPGL